MRNLRLRLTLAALPLLFWNAAAAQNPCGYAFSITGQKLFEDHCASCHGLDGKGDGPSAEGQSKKPADLTAGPIHSRNLYGHFGLIRLTALGSDQPWVKA